MPPVLPHPLFLIRLSGVAELAGGLGLLIPMRSIQVIAGWGLALMLIAIFPANIYMAAAHVKIRGFPAHAWMAWVRVALQPALILAVLCVTNLWPRTKSLT